ncbi:heat inducible transcription repressor HrcA [Mycoplasmopsis californica]|uniref:Heat-inducible transcription repressor HrcA n=1 Tax=Mycoplasmopsis equigenitalium TaxID=114883 RepID=A0ABY5J574_9BACT|nr:heat-inducible transcriptional repressor HrcA [Mycoplasmopsis equigenitalium]UUD36848.1 heat-inducible transcriptional repressor HrcA [Mycoplasmopsis equigenitalium]VEU69856.1 heat inducible transcription repressor HrcA [Mycoplasmopsis californica]
MSDKIEKNILDEKIQSYLKLIVEMYISTGEPVSSGNLLEQYNLDVSSATIRNAMAKLESMDFLVKEHISSGRIPTVKGFEYYGRYLSEDNDTNVQSKIEDIFAKRRLSIDQTLDEALKKISEAYHLTIVTSKDNSSELLKSIQLIPISERQGTIIIVSSFGNVWSKLIDITSNQNIDDVKIAIRLFKERLVDTPLIELAERSKQLAPIFSKIVKNYETLLKNFVENVFQFAQRNINTVYNKSNIILSRDISREDLNNLIETIENNSIWKTIENKTEDDKNIKIEIRGDSTLISRRLENDSQIKEISVVGSKRIDYNAAKTTLNTIGSILESENKNKGEK